MEKFMILYFFIFALAVVYAQYDDVRCKCVCPSKAPHPNSTEPYRRIFVNIFREASECKCENMLPKDMQSDNFCQKCDCQWQRRNTATIKVVVIFIVCVVSLLALYMVFLLCLDPLMSSRPRSQYEQHQDTTSAGRNYPPTQKASAERLMTSDNSAPRLRPGVLSRVKTEMKKVHGEQERWKDAVHEQRDHIYVKHTMLN